MTASGRSKAGQVLRTLQKDASREKGTDDLDVFDLRPRQESKTNQNQIQETSDQRGNSDDIPLLSTTDKSHMTPTMCAGILERKRPRKLNIDTDLEMLMSLRMNLAASEIRSRTRSWRARRAWMWIACKSVLRTKEKTTARLRKKFNFASRGSWSHGSCWKSKGESIQSMIKLLASEVLLQTRMLGMIARKTLESCLENSIMIWSIQFSV